VKGEGLHPEREETGATGTPRIFRVEAVDYERVTDSFSVIEGASGRTSIGDEFMARKSRVPKGFLSQTRGRKGSRKFIEERDGPFD